MSNFKISFWAVVFGLIGIFIFQNQDFFMAKQSFGIDIIFTNYKTPDLHNAILFGGIFLIGFIISYIFTLIDRFKFRKVVKSLGDTIASQNEKITSLINELESLTSGSSGNNEENKEEKEQESA